MNPYLLALGLVAFVVSSGCEAVSDRLGLGGTSGADVAAPIEASPRLDVGTSDDPESAEPRKKRRKKPKKKKPEPPPPVPEADLNAALARAIVPGKEPGLYRVDPFVLTLVADTLAREEGLPFTRITKKDRKAGAPRSFRVGELPQPSLWRRLGLEPGDLVVDFEGADPPGPKGLLLLRKRIPREGTLTLQLQRDGKAQTLRYEIEPGLAWTRYLETEAKRSFDPPASPRPSGDKPSGNKPSSNKPSSNKPSGNKPSKPAAVPVTCSGSTCTVPQWYVDSLLGSSSKAKQQMRGKSIGSGFKVSFVGPASRKAGFRVGDVITRVNGRRTNNQLEMLALYGGAKSTKKFRVESTRGGRKRTTTIVVK